MPRDRAQLPVPQCRALLRSPVHADLRHGGRATARRGVEHELRGAHPLRHAGLRRVRHLRNPGRMDRRQVEPRSHDGGLLRRHRGELDRDGARGFAARHRARVVRHRRVRRDLPPGRACAGGRGAGEDRHPARDQRRVRQSRGGRGGAADRLPDRHRRLAQRVRAARHRLDRIRRGLRGLRSAPDAGNAPSPDRAHRPRSARTARQALRRSIARFSSACSRSSC